MELWCKRLVKDCPDVQIDNMTTSWRNGIAFCALVHHFRPDLIDISKLKPENIYENNQLAFSLAEKHLGIPALLDPEDMVDGEVPDRLSILTYLSQFYQRLGHTVNTKSTEVESKTSSTSSSPSTTPIKFAKSGLDKCAACGLPVYLAQRLIVSHKLYHRRCFRCSKCSGHMNPKNFDIIEGSEFTCDSCKNEKTLSKFLNNNDHDQMGMLAFSDTTEVKSPEVQREDSISSKRMARPLSILEKINMFEKNSDKEKDIVTDKISSLSLKDNIDIKNRESSVSSLVSPTKQTYIESDLHSYSETDSNEAIKDKTINVESESSLDKELLPKVYKSNINQFNFLQTQLSDSTLCSSTPMDDEKPPETAVMHNIQDKELSLSVLEEPINVTKDLVEEYHFNITPEKQKDECNVTDESRLAKVHCVTLNEDEDPIVVTEPVKNDSEQEISISVPPRRKKQQAALDKSMSPLKKIEVKRIVKQYPDHLNPFDDEEDDETQLSSKQAGTNPFGSSDEEDDDVPPIQPSKLLSSNQQGTPVKRLIRAYNPFWSDGEEQSSEDEGKHQERSGLYPSSMATSTPNLPASTPRRKKAPAPPPPAAAAAAGAPTFDLPSTSMDDVASISSMSSYNSTVHSDHKSYGALTPRMTKKRTAPTPPDSLSTMSGGCGSLEKGLDASGMRSNISDGSKRKGPAPGLPLPERREVKLQMSPEELQVQLDLLETQQLGLERQGVLIEQMIRDKCEGDEPTTVPQEEVEDLVIQLCELVNEKNDLFRKQTELMYIRRQQRLEQEQADIEHEIRVIQSRPAVNRIDADKAREEQLVSRLVAIVRMRDELVQQIDAERRRERQEDRAIAVSIATKRAQRNSESNSSSMKSVEVIATPKKSKMKDKVKKQLKKAKHSLMSKKKEDGTDRKEDKPEKVQKLK